MLEEAKVKAKLEDNQTKYKPKNVRDKMARRDKNISSLEESMEALDILADSEMKELQDRVSSLEMDNAALQAQIRELKGEKRECNMKSYFEREVEKSSEEKEKLNDMSVIIFYLS
jgi:TPP-dependent pyruvate/acetoin dehydrogenase alpha subunit